MKYIMHIHINDFIVNIFIQLKQEDIMSEICLKQEEADRLVNIQKIITQKNNR